MKTKNIFLASILLLPLSLYAQSYNSANMKTTIFNNDIVRNWNDTYVVSHVTDNGESRFVCSDFSDFDGNPVPFGFNANAFFSDPLPPEYAILDFRILDDYVFFCGTKLISSYPYSSIGIVGFFDLNLFLQGQFDPQISEIPHNISLRRLTAYRTNGMHKAVAIGTDFSNGSQEIFLEIDGCTDPSPVFTLHRIANSYEQLDDVIYTGANTTLVGTIFQGINARPMIRVLDNLDDLSLSSEYGTIYYFSLHSEEINARTSSTLLEKGDIAISYVHTGSSPDQFYKRIRIIDTDTPGMPLNFNSQETNIEDKLETREMAYSKKSPKMVLLQDPLVLFIDNSHFFFLEPYSTNDYIGNMCNFLHGDPYFSIDLYNADNIISIGMGRAYLQYIPNQSYLACPENDPIDVLRIDDLVTWDLPSPVTSTNISPTLVPFNLGNHFIL